ncbi:MAG TPA: ribulokinase [Clostridiales bacterium]|nr:ribulokinase [Clostridiales bacterium]
MDKTVIGLDYGTLSARAVLVDVDNGIILADCVFEYPHGVMDEQLPDGTRLGVNWALQYPKDYSDALQYLIPAVMKKAGVDNRQVIGLGIDFTACTVLPVDTQGIPLCYYDTFKSRPHSYVKLWKHHAAQYEADRINRLARDRNEEFIRRYGGKISSEWLLPKVMQILDEDPEIYESMDEFMEAGDWIARLITGSSSRSSCMAGYKGIWHKKEGYPTKEFLRALDDRLERLFEDKLQGNVLPTGTKVGTIHSEGAKITGLREGTAVAVPVIDAHAAVPAVGITKPGKMFMIMGTSACHMLLSDREIHVPGISGVVEDGIIPGYYGYEAGQACLGDHFAWFAENCCPALYEQQAKENNMKKLAWLDEKASQLKPGESGLLALDWWNGNRSVLVDADLSGIVVGCTLQTKPEEIYRALVEATAFGTKMIIETFKENGIPVREIIAAGGIAVKSPFVMQLFADVLGLEITVNKTLQIGALGAAMFGAVAAGYDKGGYDRISEAAEHMIGEEVVLYTPIKEYTKIYESLYEEYKLLHDYFGRGKNNVMKRLKEWKSNTDMIEVP